MTTIYVTESASYLTVQDYHLLVYHLEELCCKVPIDRVSQIIVFGSSFVSREAASLALFRRIPILFLGNQGEYVSCVEYKLHEPKYLQHQVNRSFDPEFTCAMAQGMIRAKIYNCYILLLQLSANYSTPAAQIALDVMLLLSDDLAMANSIEELLEYEIMAARFYYPGLASLLPNEFNFKQRTHNTATDPINKLLNLGYSLLHQQIYTLVKAWGLHPSLASLHLESRHDSPLVYDLMAEFRGPLVDRLVMDLVNSHILTPEDFALQDPGGVYLYPEALKRFIQHWEDKLQTQIVHPYAGKVSYRRCLEVQVQEYIACLVGDVEFYRPMLVLNEVSLPTKPCTSPEIAPLMLV